MEALQTSKELCHCLRRHTKTTMKIEDNYDSHTKLQKLHRTRSQGSIKGTWKHWDEQT